MNKNLLKVIYSALFAALACVATMIIKVPTFYGYANIGDTIVLISAWLLGGVYGALAAGIGSALADLLTGYGYYVPGTFIIKFLMAFVAYLIIKKIKNKIVSFIVSGIVAELIMIVGYFFYKALILGKGYAAAVPSVFSNIAQGVTCLVLALLLYFALEKSKFNKVFKVSLQKNDAKME